MKAILQKQITMCVMQNKHINDLWSEKVNEPEEVQPRESSRDKVLSNVSKKTQKVKLSETKNWHPTDGPTPGSDAKSPEYTIYLLYIFRTDTKKLTFNVIGVKKGTGGTQNEKTSCIVQKICPKV